MTAPLSLPQRLGLVKYLADRLARVRKDELDKLALAEMPSGSRLPVMFGGRLAGFATMPAPSTKTPYVADEARFLAWAQKHYPDKVEPTVAVAIDDDLIAYLADHYPQALRHAKRVQPAWQSDICAALKGGGYYVTSAGEKLTEVPGITVPESDDPVPRVNLARDAAEVIAQAWRDGLIPADELLALPAAEGEPQP